MSTHLYRPDSCVCGWKTPKQTALESSAPEFIPDDIEFVYACPECGTKHVIAFDRNHTTRAAS